MLIRVIFFLNFFICFSQESILLDSWNSNYNYLEHSEYIYELNNLGDPIIFFVKKPALNNFLYVPGPIPSIPTVLKKIVSLFILTSSFSSLYAKTM